MASDSTAGSSELGSHTSPQGGVMLLEKLLPRASTVSSGWRRALLGSGPWVDLLYH